jgi:hypothetical protein
MLSYKGTEGASQGWGAQLPANHWYRLDLGGTIAAALKPCRMGDLGQEVGHGSLESYRFD